MEKEDCKNIIYGGDPSENGSITDGCASLGEIILKRLQAGGDFNSIINATTKETWKFSDVLKKSMSISRTLHNFGLQRNDVISIVSENRHEFSAIAFGAIFLSVIVAPINVTYTERELLHTLDLSKPKIVFVSPFAATKVVSVCKKLNYVKNVVIIEDDQSQTDNFTLSLNEMIKKYEKISFNVDDHVRRKVDINTQVALIFCSSGTTGLPKGVEITQKNAMSCLQTYRGFLKFFRASHQLSPIVINIAPWFHVLGFISMFMLSCTPDALFIFLTKFDENVFYKSIEDYKVNFLIVVPPIMLLMAKSPLFDKYNLSSVKISSELLRILISLVDILMMYLILDISSGAAPLSKEVENQVLERFKGKVKIRQGYGMSEATYGVIGVVETSKPGSIGMPYKGVYVKVIDENGRALGPNQPGELCFKGDRIMKGYINNRKATNEAIDSDGWLRSGDIGYYDEDQMFFIVDRLKELIKYKAFQVPPAEIEGLLLSNPKIKDVGVIGIPDEESGELPFAFVVKQPGETLTEQEVIDFVAENASKAKWLRGGAKFIDAIPKNPSGKILRREMREIFSWFWGLIQTSQVLISEKQNQIMESESDSNIIYGGDPEIFGSLTQGCGSLGELILTGLQKSGNKISIINGATHKMWTSRDILEHSKIMSRTLYGLGIRQNDVISIISENRHEFTSIAFGAIFLNAIVAPINVVYTERELKHTLDLSKPKIVFVSPFAATKVVSVCKKLNYVKNVVIIEDDQSQTDNFTLSLNEMIKKYEKISFNVDDHVRRKVDINTQVALIFCSSGTTGLPKGVETTQRNAMSCLQSHHGFMMFYEANYNIPPVAINVAPWFHVLGFISMFMVACSDKGTFVFLARFDEETFYKAIETHEVNFLVLVPPIMLLLAKSPLLDKYNLSCVKNISCGAAPLSKEVEDQVLERFKGQVVIRQGYGMSESTYGTIGVIDRFKAGSVGEVIKGVYVKVIDENGRALGPNQPGELCFKGDRIMKGYINNRKATNEAIDSDGWLRSGDIGYYDEDKMFFIVDRLKELIKYKAFQVPPAEIEGLLLSNPKIKDVGVIGIPDEESGELPFAFVVKQPGETLTEQEVIDFVAENASKAKWLRGGAKFIDAIPKNPISLTHLRCKQLRVSFEMDVKSDPNIIYGGDIEIPEDEEEIDYASLGDQIVSDFKLGFNRTSFINGVTNEIWTFRDQLEQSTIIARTLFGAGFRQNDVISIISENRHEFPAIAFGAFYLNAIVAPLNTTYTERELKHALQLSKPKFVFVSPFAAKRVIAACRKLKFVKNVILIGDGVKGDSFAIPLKDLIRKYEKIDFKVEDFTTKKMNTREQIALIVCSSGTTGMPKGVSITQQNMMTTFRIYREAFKLGKMINPDGTIVLNVAPWFHAMGFVSMFLVACSRETVFIFLPKFEEERFLQVIEKYKINTLTVVPPVCVFLAKSPLVDKYDISSVKVIGCGAAALSKEVDEKVCERLNVVIRQGYGMSETTMGTMGTNALVKPGSVGQALKGVYVKVIDENGKTLGPNQPGELCFKGDVLMKGYVDDPKATSQTIDSDGWLHSGDIGYYDEDQMFYIVDRLKELIKYKASQVPPAEIEGLLLSNPKIKDVGVIGIPDEESGELPFAFVVKQPGETLTEQEVIDFVAENASKAKWLRGGVKFIDNIPRNPSGKLLRREMRLMYKNSKSKL
ncbi:CLUMA_CG014231, isoform A [Clunio marinus]|uniref:Luciferin 4-monooxygenase n=1 Tax=Clunio marinus TaxID=568069 RepID=A0A1J1IMR6_9DIPT|nr:CLUMA_CG014231, isoform A [Clunio marinus]